MYNCNSELIELICFFQLSYLVYLGTLMPTWLLLDGRPHGFFFFWENSDDYQTHLDSYCASTRRLQTLTAMTTF